MNKTRKNDILLFQKRLLILLDEFDKICKENKITYWLDGGTFLGAVRHHGFIPWDDDIDVSVHLSDYEGLKKILNEYVANKPNRLLFFYGKIFRLTEYYGDSEYLKDAAFPIRIDITPMKYILDDEKVLELDKSFTQLIQLYNFGRCKNEELITREHYEKYYPTPGKYASKMKDVVTDYFSFINKQKETIDKNKITDFFVNYVYEDILVKKQRDHFHSSMIFPIRELSFENRLFDCPNSSEYLNVLYGDFMKLPPLDQQVATQRKLVKSKFKSKKRLENFIIDVYKVAIRHYALGKKNKNRYRKIQKPLSFCALVLKYTFKFQFVELKCLIDYSFLELKSRNL
jgi:lipopolysaccharide cholinephosphotransferase